jgi:hypothetical protein
MTHRNKALIVLVLASVGFAFEFGRAFGKAEQTHVELRSHEMVDLLIADNAHLSRRLEAMGASAADERPLAIADALPEDVGGR